MSHPLLPRRQRLSTTATIQYRSWLYQLFCRHTERHEEATYHMINRGSGVVQHQRVVVFAQCRQCGRVLVDDQRDWVKNL